MWECNTNDIKPDIISAHPLSNALDETPGTAFFDVKYCDQKFKIETYISKFYTLRLLFKDCGIIKDKNISSFYPKPLLR